MRESERNVWRDHIDVDPTFGCWIWNHKRSSNGRPIVWLGARPTYAYKIAYEETYGEVPAGLVLEHSCRNPLCCRPDHLEAVTQSMNERLKSPKFRLARTSCRNGHRLDETSRLMTPTMGVLCRRCQGPVTGSTTGRSTPR